MQWMTVTSLVPCHALHVPQHVAVSSRDNQLGKLLMFLGESRMTDWIQLLFFFPFNLIRHTLNGEDLFEVFFKLECEIPKIVIEW